MSLSKKYRTPLEFIEEAKNDTLWQMNRERLEHDVKTIGAEELRRTVSKDFEEFIPKFMKEKWVITLHDLEMMFERLWDSNYTTSYFMDKMPLVLKMKWVEENCPEMPKVKDMENELALKQMEVCENRKKKEEIMRRKRERLENSNEVFSEEKVEDGEEIEVDLLKLYYFIKEHFVQNLLNQYEWAVLFVFLHNRGLMKSQTTAAAFETQMREWFDDVELKCQSSDISRYSKLMHYEYEEWNVQQLKIAKTTEDKIQRMKHVYKKLEGKYVVPQKV